MPKTIRFIGDVHGKYKPYKRIIENSPPSIQVGDMGVGFLRWPHGEEYGNPPHYMMVPDHRFIRGNHDSPAACARHSQWIPDGHIEGNMMFIGGATSIDKAYRIEGFSWWADEELSSQRLGELVDLYQTTKPEIMVTHDCPQMLVDALFGIHYKVQLEPGGTRTRQALHNMWCMHPPKLWIFGHWHQSKDVMIDGTRFICLAELEYKDLEV